MADQVPDGGKHDTTDYSASKAPETRPAVESRVPAGDSRLLPGGAHGSPADVGMSAVDRADLPSGGTTPDELDTATPADDKA